MSVETCSFPTVKSSELDFRAEYIRKHFGFLTENDYSSEEARALIYNLSIIELTYTFLERYLKAPLVHYSYQFTGESLTSRGYEFLGDNSFKEAIQKRKEEGKPYSREEAEFEGVHQFKQTLLDSREPTNFLLVSPPPPVGELHLHPGYADYSFYYFGQFDPMTRRVDMYAWKNEKDLVVQRDEINSVLKRQHLPSDVHPNDFLRLPVFADGYSFDVFREVILDMPTEAEFEKAKNKRYEQYREGIGKFAEMLTGLIVNGACEQTLLNAQVQIEMEFTKWVSDGEVKPITVDPRYFRREYHLEFSREVIARFALFLEKYDTQKFACGSCGRSVLGLVSIGNLGIGLMNSMLFSSVIGQVILEARVRTMLCPACKEVEVEIGGKCPNPECGMTKQEYDAKMISRD